jgi:hypothetical protein
MLKKTYDTYDPGVSFHPDRYKYINIHPDPCSAIFYGHEIRYDRGPHCNGYGDLDANRSGRQFHTYVLSVHSRRDPVNNPDIHAGGGIPYFYSDDGRRAD